MISWYFVLSLILQQAYFLKSFRLNTNHGCIDGHPTEVHPDVTEFLGVPFALPPIGPLRFKPPKILTHNYYNYAGHCFNAMYPAKACLFKRKAVGFVSIDEWQPKNNEMHENCLRLNMWVPKNKTGGVMVFFNGRSYHRGFGSLPQYDATILSHKTGLIVVNVNYRNGVLGFAHLKRKKFVPGNIGLLDQQMALQWVYENIKYFGGKQSMITLFGIGTSGSAATAHMLSEGSKKYFSRVIASSGTIINDFGYEKSSIIEKNIKKLVYRLKCNYKKYEKKVKCMQKMNASIIVDEADRIHNPKQFEIKYPFIAVDNDGIFFKKSIKKLLAKGKFKTDVDILIGQTTNEPSIFIFNYLKGKKFGCSFDPRKSVKDTVNQCNMNKRHYLNTIVKVTEAYKLKRIAVSKIAKLYEWPKERSYRDRAIRIIADFVFDCNIVEFGRKISHFILKGSKYYYVLGRRVSITPWPLYMGATHDYQTHYMFGHPYLNPSVYGKKVEEEQKFSHQIMNTLSKFATTGKLYTNWPQFTFKNMVAVNITHVLKPGEKFPIIDVYSKQCQMIKFIKHRYRYRR